MTEIDVRTLAPRERHPLIFQTFDALPPGGELQLVSDHDPRPLLFSFQRTRTGHYDWSFLEHGPDVFRVVIGRRLPERENRATVGDLLGRDHDRLDAILQEVQRAAAAGDFDLAAQRFAAFHVGLAAHIRGEEQQVFPAFERLSGGDGGSGPTAVMRVEHREIERQMEAIAAAIAGRRLPSYGGLVDVLTDHNDKEEAVLYPSVDQMLDDADRLRLCLDIEAA